MRRKHSALYTPRRALELEQEEFPRYALYLSDEDRVVFASAPDRPRDAMSVQDFVDRLVRAVSHPRLERLPMRFVVPSDAFLRLARTAPFAAGLLWGVQARREQSQANLVVVHLQTRLQTDACLQVLSPQLDTGRNEVALVMLPTRALHEYLQSPAQEW